MSETDPDHSKTDTQAALERGCATVRDLEARLEAERKRLAQLRAGQSDAKSAIAFGFVLPAAG